MRIHDSHNQFLLTNRKGGYGLLSNGARSTYNGFFCYVKDEMYKVIDDIRVKESSNEVDFEFWRVKRTLESYKDSFFMPFGMNALVYESSKLAEFELILDCKKSYDGRVWGRNYSISEEGNYIVIHFVKKSDSREDSSHDEVEYELFTVIDKRGIDFDIVDQWPDQYYEWDSKREGRDIRRHVFNALRIRAKSAIITFGTDKSQCIKEARLIAGHIDQLESECSQYIANIMPRDLKDFSNKEMYDKFGKSRQVEIDSAYKCSINAVDQLFVHGDAKGSSSSGMFAGLPWFFQFWSRDELISLKGLQIAGHLEDVRDILVKYIDSIRDDGRIPNRFPHSDLASADGIGWLFKRFGDFLVESRKKGVLSKLLSKEEFQRLIGKLEVGLNQLKMQHTRGYLAYNSKDETWMDTTWGDDNRDGYCIEIQTLFLNAYRLMYSLTNNYKYKVAEENMKRVVRDKFWNDKVLADRKDDFTKRSNVFMAAYIYPDLLSTEEWTTCFENTLNGIWLEWGGITTLDKSHPLYVANYTGQNNQSYHRGDSWYFVNNMAATVMQRINPERFREKIDSILKASTKEVLHSGIIGSHAEVSSASEQKSEASLCQLWSSATYVELVNEIFR